VIAEVKNDIDFDFRFQFMKSSFEPLDGNLTVDN